MKTGVWGRGCGWSLALGSQALLGERGLLGHRLVIVGPQFGHHLDEGQALDLGMKGLCGGRAGTGLEGVMGGGKSGPRVGGADLNP